MINNGVPFYRDIKRNLVYEINLSIYPVAVCGEDLQKGNPIRVSDRDESLSLLKSRVNELILSSVREDGKCFVEMTVTENGMYFSYEEMWFYVDHEHNSKHEVVL